jgi:heterodisulfide reductase subunit C
MNYDTMAVQPSLKGSVAPNTLAEVLRCYQCRKCSSGCPVSFSMELLPHQVMRMIQLEADRELLTANTAWVCAGCQTCTTRCPNDIDIAGVMDELRQLAAGQWFSDIPMGIGMLLRGKLRILPRRIRERRQMRTLFSKRTRS